MAAITTGGRLPEAGESLQRLLLHYLAEIAPGAFPGADGLHVNDVLHSYSRFAASGMVPGQRELLFQHPEFRIEVEAFFAREGAL